MAAGYRRRLAPADRLAVSICPTVHIGLAVDMSGDTYRSAAGAAMSRRILSLACLLCIQLAFPGLARAADPELLVFAAASLTNAFEKLGPIYTKESGQPVKFSFAASSALARQLESGASADVFASADLEWMDYVQARGLIDRGNRRDLLGNRLVLIAPKDSTVTLKIAPGFALAKALGPGGRLATGDPDYVPVGKYARSALTTLGVWSDVADRLVRADNVRTALAFVARGEAPLGIVYTTDAQIEPGVRVVDVFPEDTHLPITYPVAVVRGAHPGADRFVKFLSGDAARAVFQEFGFIALP
jgi:molybdate transport system substrate-binding protein